MTLSQWALILGSYMLGSIPTGYWLCRTWKGVDIRTQGSGNVGATNVARVLGIKAGVLTYCIDFTKGMIPVVIAQHLFGADSLWPIAAGLSAIIGHTLSVFVRFKGGKGVATSSGVFAALLLIPFAIGITVFSLVTVFSRYVSLGSLAGALTIVVSTFALSYPRPLCWTTVTVALFVFWTHRANIQRLINGTESQIQWRKKEV